MEKELDQTDIEPRKSMRVDRVPTGIRRLDDLFSGGLPAKVQFGLTGPPYIGKEIIAYRFLAKG
jgi:KaiC/GvpD/RAD55 family RecA-like ATPase